MAATAGEAVGAHHVAEGQGVYLEAQGQRSAGTWPQPPGLPLQASQAVLGVPGLNNCRAGLALSQTHSCWGTRVRQARASVSSALLWPGCGGRAPAPGLAP